MKERPILFSAPMVRAILDGRKTQTRRIVKPQPGYHGIAGFCFEKHPFAPSTFKGTPAEGMKPVAPEKNVWVAEDWVKNIVGVLGDCPYGQPGDRLWVRETFAINCIHAGWGKLPKRMPDIDHENPLVYRAYGDWDEQFGPCDGVAPPWRPSIHMPRWASRITLEVTGVRVERLQAISEKDAGAEGVEYDGGWEEPCGEGYTDGFGYLNYLSEEEEFEFDSAKESFRSLWESINGAESWDVNPWVWVVEFRRLP